MSVQRDASLSIACAENIALLQFLHTVPAQPSLIDVHQFAADDNNTRLLPLEQERRLTGILATLSSIREDVNRITAVAVRELPSLSTLQVLIAVNKANSLSGNTYLGEVEAGFSRIFALLSHATDEENSKLELKVFAEIVSTCEDRILSRLRLKKRKYNRDMTPLDDRIDDISKTVTSHHGDTARDFAKASRRLALEIKAYKKHQKTADLCRLVEEAESWTRATKDASEILRTIPSRVLNPRTYQDLRSIIRKIAQYRIAARRLFRLACAFPILRRMTVQAVSLADHAFAKPGIEDYEPSLLQTLHRIEGFRANPGLLETLCLHLGEKITPENAQKQFDATVKRALTESKVHAEVQILAYLLKLPRSERANVRVVQSSKKGCFLCTQLFEINKGPTMPKGHGRIYEAWRVPSVPGLKKLHVRLNIALEKQARESIAMLLQKKRKIGYPDPYESSALTASASTIVAASSSAKVTTSNLQSRPQDITESPKSTDSSPISSASDISSHAPLQPSASSAVQEDRRELEQTPVDVSRAFDDHSLLAGQTSLAGIFQGTELWIHYSVDSHYKKLDQALRFNVRQLNENEAVAAWEQSSSAIYDVSRLEQGSEIIMKEAPSYYLDLDGTLVRLALCN